MLKTVCAVLTAAGGLNLGLIGLFSFDAAAWLCGGSATAAARIVYLLMALATTAYLIVQYKQSKQKEEQKS